MPGRFSSSPTCAAGGTWYRYIWAPIGAADHRCRTSTTSPSASTVARTGQQGVALAIATRSPIGSARNTVYLTGFEFLEP